MYDSYKHAERAKQEAEKKANELERRLAALEQERRVVTAIPGPKSQELQARRTAVVAQGVGSVLPVFTARAGGP